MNEFTEETGEQASEITDRVEETWENASSTAAEKLEQGKDYVRTNQLPVLLGALAAGLVLGLLVPRKKPEPVVSALETRIDELKEILGSFKSKVGTTAGDQYDTLSSVLNGALKKAKKHLSIS